ncbi:MAG: alpha/beta hydrolase [Halieaceae bacterium]|nr:alpha/beta hydrolase [Halieaceae bacterium]
MELDPEVPPLLELFEAMGVPDPATVTPEELREAMAMPPPENPTPVARVEARDIAGPAGPIHTRIFHPEAPAGAPAPVLLFFHGGGWVVGDVTSHDEVCRQLCAGSGCIVVSVDYRLAPEHPFPGGLEDCYAVTQWVADNAAELDGDGARLAVGGDSAGGNLAAAVCLLARERGGPAIGHQLLIYPVTDSDFDRPSYIDNADGYLLTRGMMQWFWEQYLVEPAHSADPLAAPLLAELAGLPAATVVTAGFDPLRDEGRAFAEKLESFGVPVDHREFKGMVHGFVSMGAGLTQTGVAVEYLCQRLKDALAE